MFTRVKLAAADTLLSDVLAKMLGDMFSQTFQKLHLLRRGKFDQDHYLAELSELGTSGLRVRDVTSVPVLRSQESLARDKRPHHAKHLILLGVVPDLPIEDVLATIAEEGLFDQFTDGILPPAIGIHYEY